MEKLNNHSGNQNLDLEIENLIKKEIAYTEIGSTELALAAQLFSKKLVNLDALSRVPRKNWNKFGVIGCEGGG